MLEIAEYREDVRERLRCLREDSIEKSVQGYDGKMSEMKGATKVAKKMEETEETENNRDYLVDLDVSSSVEQTRRDKSQAEFGQRYEAE